MKKTKILYWTFTGLFAFLMFGSAIPDVFSHLMAVKGMHEELGYPIYFIPFIGIAKWGQNPQTLDYQIVSQAFCR